MEDEKYHLTLKIKGHVQGVFFRQTTEHKARELGLAGLVRNEPDGSVYIEAEGNPQALAQFRQWCHIGPESAKVEEVEAEEGKVKGYHHFEVKR